MQKVLVAEIGNETTVVNAFGDLDTDNPRLLGQGLSSTTLGKGDVGISLSLAISNFEQNSGPLGSPGEIPLYATSSLPTQLAALEIKGYNISDIPGKQGKLQTLLTSRALRQAAQLIYEEVGDILILYVGSASTDVYSVTSEFFVQRTAEQDLSVFSNAWPLVKYIGENRIKEHHGQAWKKLLKTTPEMLEEIALSAELTAAALKIALQRHIERQDLRQIQWVIGTGSGLTQLPNALNIMRESIKEMEGHWLPQEGFAILLDRDCLMVSLGVLATTFRQAAWQLLRESLGVEN